MAPRFLLAAVLIACLGCSSQTDVDVVARIRSRDGTLEAIHARPQTGATVGFVDWVYVVAAGSKPEGEPVFVADKVDGPIRLIWAEHELTIAVDRARVFKAGPTAVVKAPRGDVTAMLKVVVAEPLT